MSSSAAWTGRTIAFALRDVVRRRHSVRARTGRSAGILNSPSVAADAVGGDRRFHLYARLHYRRADARHPSHSHGPRSAVAARVDLGRRDCGDAHRVRAVGVAHRQPVDRSRDRIALRAASAVTINVIGHQWWWEIDYEDAVPSRRVLTAN